MKDNKNTPNTANTANTPAVKNGKNTPAANKRGKNTPAADTTPAAPAPVKIDAPFRVGAKTLRTEILLTDLTDAVTGENVLDVLNASNTGAEYVAITYASRCFRHASAWLLYTERAKALSDAVGVLLTMEAAFDSELRVMGETEYIIAQTHAENAARDLLYVVSVDVDNVGNAKAKLPSVAAFVDAVKARLKVRDVKSTNGRGESGAISPTAGRAAIERAFLQYLRGNIVMTPADVKTRGLLNKLATATNNAANAYADAVVHEQFTAAIWAGIDENDAARAAERLSAHRSWESASKVAERAARTYVARAAALENAVNGAAFTCDSRIFTYAPRAGVSAYVFIRTGADGRLYVERPSIDALKADAYAAYNAERERAKAAAEKAAADAADAPADAPAESAAA